MYRNEQKILRFSMVLLFLGLMIVYIVWYQIKGDMVSTMPETKEQSTIPTISMSLTSQEELSQEIATETEVATGKSDIATGKSDIATGKSDIATGKSNTGIVSSIKSDDTIKMLSGTSMYYGKIDIIEKLGIKYKYALTDSSGVRYIYLGTPNYDFASIARALK
jgi:hypothetical protein